MGWKGYEYKIPLGMIFKKMYCHQCGVLLKREKITDTYLKGQDGYSNEILGHSTLGMSKIERSYYMYKCPGCGLKISYDMQCIIAQKQKQAKKHIVGNND